MLKVFFKSLALACISVMIMSCSDNGGSANQTLETIMSRKSVRQYTSEPVSDRQVETLMKAAMAAPSAMNKQPWKFVVVKDREALDSLAESLPYAKMLKEAPLAVVVCGETLLEDGSYNKFWQHDCSAAAENLLLAAESIGLGAVWTAAFPDEARCKAIKTVLGIPSTVMPLCVIPVGHPAGDTQPKDKYKAENIHFNRW